MVQKPTLIIDTREKIPWDFEYDDAFENIIYKKLDAGDYSIEGMEDIITIERKAGTDELYSNFSNKTKKRQIFAEFERAKDYKFKFLVIEDSCDDIMNPHKYYVNKPNSRGKTINKRSPKMPIAVVTSGLTKLMLEHNVQVVFGGPRAQAMAKGILLHAYDMHRKGKLVESD
jgi:ERCC4-type nuclease